MQILSLIDTPIEKVIATTCAVLSAGGLVIFPTETTYGAGVDATNQAAVDKLLAYKSRREGKPLSIAVISQEMAEAYVELNEQARTLYAQFLPGPVTVVSKDKGVVAHGVASEFGTVGVRIPDYPMLLELLKVYGKPITATSANGSGQKRPYSIQDIFDNISDKQKSLIDLVLDAGTLPENPPSTVIDTTLSAPVTLRQGDIQLKTAVGKSGDEYVLRSESEAETKSIAGRLVLKHWDKVAKTGLVIGLDGPLGAGKTVFAKGVAEFLQITDLLTSPTYTYIEEYDFQRHQTAGKLYHLDMWKVDSPEVFGKLELPELLKPGTVMVIEWWSQIGAYFLPILEKQNVPVITAVLEEATRSSLDITSDFHPQTSEPGLSLTPAQRILKLKEIA